MHKINYTDDIDLSKISRRGSFDKSKLPSEAVRSYCVSVRLNIEELQLLNIKRGS
jgi:phosphatidate phosphatase PAH1